MSVKDRSLMIQEVKLTGVSENITAFMMVRPPNKTKKPHTHCGQMFTRVRINIIYLNEAVSLVTTK